MPILKELAKALPFVIAACGPNASPLPDAPFQAPIVLPATQRPAERPSSPENEMVKGMARDITSILISQAREIITPYLPPNQRNFRNDENVREFIYDYFRFLSDPSCSNRKVVGTDDVKDAVVGPNKFKVVVVNLDAECLMRFRLIPGLVYSRPDGQFQQGLGKKVGMSFINSPDGKWYLSGVVPDFVPQK